LLVASCGHDSTAVPATKGIAPRQSPQTAKEVFLRNQISDHGVTRNSYDIHTVPE
jgi:hypothetical protein